MSPTAPSRPVIMTSTESPLLVATIIEIAAVVGK